MYWRFRTKLEFFEIEDFWRLYKIFGNGLTFLGILKKLWRFFRITTTIKSNISMEFFYFFLESVQKFLQVLGINWINEKTEIPLGP